MSKKTEEATEEPASIGDEGTLMGSDGVTAAPAEERAQMQRNWNVIVISPCVVRLTSKTFASVPPGKRGGD